MCHEEQTCDGGRDNCIERADPPDQVQGAETSDSTNVNEPFLKQMQQLHAFETKGLAAVIHEEQSAASETQQAAELLAQREMTAQGQDLWQSCQTEVNGAPYGQCKKRAPGRLTRCGATPCATM